MKPTRDPPMAPRVEASYAAARAARELWLTLQPLDVVGADERALGAFRARRPEAWVGQR